MNQSLSQKGHMYKGSSSIMVQLHPYMCRLIFGIFFSTTICRPYIGDFFLDENMQALPFGYFIDTSGFQNGLNDPQLFTVLIIYTTTFKILV